jgi:hypothetical protein
VTGILPGYEQHFNVDDLFLKPTLVPMLILKIQILLKDNTMPMSITEQEVYKD